MRRDLFDSRRLKDVAQPVISDALVRRLVAAQFLQWADLPVHPVARGGWENRTFHLGEQMIVRLPSAADYAIQVEKEQRWLPKLAPLLPLPIPMPLALGEPASDYPWRWSIYRWLDGETAAPERIADLRGFATDLANFSSRCNESTRRTDLCLAPTTSIVVGR